jgi:hypothetical protein
VPPGRGVGECVGRRVAGRGGHGAAVRRVPPGGDRPKLRLLIPKLRPESTVTVSIEAPPVPSPPSFRLHSGSSSKFDAHPYRNGKEQRLVFHQALCIQVRPLPSHFDELSKVGIAWIGLQSSFESSKYSRICLWMTWSGPVTAEPFRVRIQSEDLWEDHDAQKSFVSSLLNLFSEASDGCNRRE